MTTQELMKKATFLKSMGFVKSEKKADEIATTNGGEMVLQDGDEIILPNTDKPEIFERKFGNGVAYAIVVERNEEPIPFYFSMLRKWAIPYDKETNERAKDENGVDLPRIEATGTAAEAFKAAKTFDAFMKENKGKTLVVVSHEIVYTCINPNNDPQYRTTWVYKVDFK